jgi:hypothetical protein
MAEKIVEKSGILERKAIIKNADMTEDMQLRYEAFSQVLFLPAAWSDSFAVLLSSAVHLNFVWAYNVSVSIHS